MHTTQTGLLYYTSSMLSVPHGMFSRNGGVSTPPFHSLNLSYNVGDTDQNIRRNRTLILKELQLGSLASAQQIHSDNISVVSSYEVNEELHGVDALISNLPGIGLLVQQADCQAVLLYDPVSQSIGAIHNGWRGSVQNIIGKTIRRMEQEFGVVPEQLYAVISPSLGPCCAEFKHYPQELPEWMHPYQVRRNYFDFWAISRVQLQQAGVQSARIDTAALCTCCQDNFFSYRRSVKQGSKTGRNGSVIGLPA